MNGECISRPVRRCEITADWQTDDRHFELDCVLAEGHEGPHELGYPYFTSNYKPHTLLWTLRERQ